MHGSACWPTRGTDPWHPAKRETQIANVMQVTVGMYADLQGIVGQSLQKIESLTFDDDNEHTPRQLQAN